MGTFALDLKAICEKNKTQMDTVVRRTVLSLLRKVVMKSPVGNKEYWASLHPYMSLVTPTGRAKKTPASGDVLFNYNAKTKSSGYAGPEGYVGGRFRANWQYGFSSAPTGELYDPKDTSFPGIDSIIGAADTLINNSPAAGVHYIANNLPYANRLENGWSKQAPSGIVSLSMIEIQSELPK